MNVEEAEANAAIAIISAELDKLKEGDNTGCASIAVDNAAVSMVKRILSMLKGKKMPTLHFYQVKPREFI